MDQSFSVYLPADRCRALAMGISLPEHTEGTALFADISGFTPLTEALTRELGPRRGAEELTRQLNLVYDALIGEVERYGGSVIGFAGDAITCWFDKDGGLRATACALALQATTGAFATTTLPSGHSIALAVKVAVAHGPVRRFQVGDPDIQLIDTLTGATLARMAAAEQVARQGEVVLDAATARALGEAVAIQTWRTHEGGTVVAVVAGLRQPVATQPWTPLPALSLPPATLRPWLLPTIYERLQAGQGEFLTELRPVVALFLRFGGIDYEADPEAGQRLDAFIRWVQHLLVQYGGTLLQLTMGEKGSYLYATFGAPIAHADDTRRALLTALHLRTLPADLSFISEIQIGITQGTMRTGAYGGRTRRTYGALGDEVNLAARLMAHARPGQILASQAVQAATPLLFAWQPLAAIRVKGKQEAVALFALLGQAQPGPIHLAEPTYTLPLVGRSAELALLAEKLALVRQGRGQVVGITGEAGMGKSRLVAETIRLAQAQGFTGFGGECHAYGTHTPYLVWHTIWRNFFGLVASNTPTQQIEHLRHIVAALDVTLLPRLPLLAPLLDLPLPENELTNALTPEARKAARETLLVDLLAAHARQVSAQQGALLLVLEDCHWLDAASHDLLEVLARAIWNQPVLVLLAYRPPELEHLEGPRVSTLPYFTLLPLRELAESEAAHLVASRLGARYPHEARPLPAPLVAQFVERAQGNPFYIEELTNDLHEQGLDPYAPETAEELVLPTSLHRLILGRIDRLSEPQKVMLKVASIIGRLFRFSWLVGYYPALGDPALVQRDLDVLSRLDLTPLERPEPELVYLFKHILTREVAYESLPYAQRAQLHEALAAFLEGRGPAHVEGYLDLLAYHYALSQNHEKARAFLRRAGEAAQVAYANSAAQAYYERLLPLLTEAGDQLEIHLRLGLVLQVVGRWEQALTHYQAALALAEAVGQQQALAQSTLALGKLYRMQGQHAEAQAWLLEALDRWEALGETDGQSRTLGELGALALGQGDYSRAVAYLEQSQTLCRASGDQVGLASALNGLGIVAGRQGNYAEAERLYEESLALRRQLGDKAGIAQSLNNLGLVALFQGHASAQALFEESLALKREMGDKQGVALSLNNLGLAATNQGNHTLAQALYEESLALRREMGDPQGIALSLNNLGLAAANQGNYTLARTLYEESLGLFQALDNRQGIAGSLSNLGLAAYRLADEAGAEEYYRAGLRLAQEIGAQAQIIETLVGLAALAAHQGDAAYLGRAVCLLAAAETLQARLGHKLQWVEQVLYDEVLAATRSRLDMATFTAAWARGQTMTRDEVVALLELSQG